MPMGKHRAPERAAQDDAVAPNTQPMLAIHRVGPDGDPYLAVSSYQHSTGVEFTKPGCQYIIGNIIVHGEQHDYRQALLVSFDSDNDRAIVTSRLHYPHELPVAVRVPSLEPAPAPDGIPTEVDFMDCDYRLPDVGLREIHIGRLGIPEAVHYADPIYDRLAAFYGRLLDTAIAASR